MVGVPVPVASAGMYSSTVSASDRASKRALPARKLTTVLAALSIAVRRDDSVSGAPEVGVGAFVAGDGG